jgi:hypothetical protein
MNDELTFLRYFYHAAGEVFGPADSDVYAGIKEDYERDTGNTVPSDYRGDADD